MLLLWRCQVCTGCAEGSRQVLQSAKEKRSSWELHVTKDGCRASHEGTSGLHSILLVHCASSCHICGSSCSSWYFVLIGHQLKHEDKENQSLGSAKQHSDVVDWLLDQPSIIGWSSSSIVDPDLCTPRSDSTHTEELQMERKSRVSAAPACI